MLISQLQHSLCSAISPLPFRHPLPKLSRAALGRPFFSAFFPEKLTILVEKRNPVRIGRRESPLHGGARFEAPHLGYETAGQRRELPAVTVDVGVADFDVGKPL